MNYSEKDFISDFVRRTRRNLKIIREHYAANPKEHEFATTQMINSLLGLLVFPKEEYFNELKNISYAELVRRNWPLPRHTMGADKITDLATLMRYMRNGIVHCNIKFEIDVEKQITGITLWNCLHRGAPKNWEAEINLADLESLTDHFLKELGNLNKVKNLKP